LTGWFVYQRVGAGVERIVAEFPNSYAGYRAAIRRAKYVGPASDVTVDRYPPSAPVVVMNPERALKAEAQS